MNEHEGMIYFAALYISDIWHAAWRRNSRDLHAKARAMVIYDRVMDGQVKVTS